MILIIPSLILLLIAKGVRLDNCSYEVVNERGESVDYEKECDAKSKPCVVKCCAQGEWMKFVAKGDYVCKSKEELKKEMVPWNFTDDLLESYSGIHIIKDNGDYSNKTLLSDFHILYRKYLYNSVECPSEKIPNVQPILNMKENGWDPYVDVSSLFYCYDISFTKENVSVIKQDYVYILIIDAPDSTKEIFMDKFMAYGTLVSAIFLLLTLAVYALLKDLHNKFTGLATMMLIVSLTSVMLCVSVYRFYKLRAREELELLTKLCVWLMPLVLYLTNAAFFWMNGLSFAIWWTFRDIENQEFSRGGSYRAKFVRYALYAWGSPALLLAFALLMDAYAPDYMIKPQFNTWFYDNAEFFHSNKMYLHLPWIILIITNIVLYVITIYNMWMSKKDLRNPNFNAAKYKKNNQQFIVFIKLAAVMGVSWTIELAQSLSNFESDSITVGCILNFPNVFFGVIIFFILVVKKNIMIKLCKRVGIENRWTLRGTQTKSSLTGGSKSRMRSNDESIELESINVSNADTLKIGDRTKNPAFQSTRM